MSQQKISIPLDLFNALMNYIGTRPLQEVLPLYANMEKAAKEHNEAAKNAALEN